MMFQNQQLQGNSQFLLIKESLKDGGELGGLDMFYRRKTA
jgi:hypothetical protein